MSELDQFAKDIADAIGHGQREKCERHAKYLVSLGYRRVGPDEAVVPREPSNEMLLAGLERGLAWMEEHGVDGLSPWQDYPKPTETMRVIVRAMLATADPGKPKP